MLNGTADDDEDDDIKWSNAFLFSLTHKVWKFSQILLNASDYIWLENLIATSSIHHLSKYISDSSKIKVIYDWLSFKDILK